MNLKNPSFINKTSEPKYLHNFLFEKKTIFQHRVVTILNKHLTEKTDSPRNLERFGGTLPLLYAKFHFSGYRDENRNRSYAVP